MQSHMHQLSLIASRNRKLIRLQKLKKKYENNLKLSFGKVTSILLIRLEIENGLFHLILKSAKKKPIPCPSSIPVVPEVSEKLGP